MATKTIKAILIDDEITGLENLRQKIEAFCTQVEILAAIPNSKEVILTVKNLKPEVLFLNIELSENNHFNLLKELNNYESEIIFTTYDNPVLINAFRISTFDYLIKPVAIEDLENSLRRFTKKKILHTRERLQILKDVLQKTPGSESRIAVPVKDTLEFIFIKDIIRIELNYGYARIFLSNGNTLLTAMQIKDFEEMLTPFHFFRTHNNHLINLHHLKKILKVVGNQALMDNGDQVEIDPRKKISLKM